MAKWEYIDRISKRGDRYGRNGGVLDLLVWCKKTNTASVTEGEAYAFWLDPKAEYRPPYDEPEKK